MFFGKQISMFSEKIDMFWGNNRKHVFVYFLLSPPSCIENNDFFNNKGFVTCFLWKTSTTYRCLQTYIIHMTEILPLKLRYFHLPNSFWFSRYVYSVRNDIRIVYPSLIGSTYARERSDKDKTKTWMNLYKKNA